MEFTGGFLAREDRQDAQSQNASHRVDVHMDVKRLPDAKLEPVGVTCETYKE